MKQMKFAKELVDLIQSGEKTSTWRLFDDKNLQTGDEVLFVRRPEIVPFAKARLTHVYEKKFKELTDTDKEGHEQFSTNHGMYTTYTGYYGRPVNGYTVVKIIRFEILEWL